jgi:RNA polymerase sigma-70 factor (ECF subfamily)
MTKQRPGAGSSGNPTEQEWAAAARLGDGNAFDQLVRRVRPRLYRWALLRTLDSDDAEDVVQTVLLRMQRALPAYRANAAIGSWLYTMVRHAAIDLLRSRSRRERRHARAGAELSAGHADAGDSELLHEVREQLRALPHRQRVIFDLADLQEHSPAEIAALLGMNPNTVRVHLLRARRNLRRRLLAADPFLLEDRA